VIILVALGIQMVLTVFGVHLSKGFLVSKVFEDAESIPELLNH